MSDVEHLGPSEKTARTSVCPLQSEGSGYQARAGSKPDQIGIAAVHGRRAHVEGANEDGMH
ncbi:hypothetical protein [Bradyrhizobium sp. USDA 3650]